MDTQSSTTSFIPKQSLNTKISERREPIGIITTGSIAILVLAVVYFAAIFAYRYTLYNQIYKECSPSGETSCGLKASLEQVRQNFQYEELARFKRLDAKLKAGSSVLNAHLAFKPLFDKLQTVTAHGIQFTKFEYGKSGLVLSGLAASYEDIAYESQVLTAETKKPVNERAITAYTFSDFDLDAKGNVTFKLTLSVDPGLLLSFVKNNQ